jgi:translation initiation factor 2 beta subunit (eIF-2beta)/eIF-5
MINIGNTKDPFYRYKMSRPILCQEGKNQNTRTIIKNFKTICEELNREPVYIEKYIRYKLNLRTKCLEHELIVHGNHEVSGIQKIISEYINDYVLCNTCQNPETFIVNNKTINALKCIACGSVTRIDCKNDKYNKYLLKTIKASADILTTKPKSIKMTTNPVLEDPIVVVTKFLESKNELIARELYDELVRIKLSRSCNDTDMIELLIKLYVNRSIKKLSDVLTLFTFSSDELFLITTVDVLIKLKNEQMIVDILEDIRDEYMDESKIKTWISLQNAQSKIGKILIKYSKWLDNADEE